MVKVTGPMLLRATGLSGVLAGLLFIAIQPIHPADELASVTISTWAWVHYATLAMEVLFLFGLAGIYVRQIAETGWLGLVGYLVLSLGLMLTFALGAIEAFVTPLMATSQPGFVEGFLGLVKGSPTGADLGAIPTLYAAHDALFVLGLLVFGVATLRANVSPRWASALFAFGVPVFGVIVALTPFITPRIAAVPIGLGLAGMGWALWSERRVTASRVAPGNVVPEPDAI
jgi:hypothetical protein